MTNQIVRGVSSEMAVRLFAIDVEKIFSRLQKHLRNRQRAYSTCSKENKKLLPKLQRRNRTTL